MNGRLTQWNGSSAGQGDRVSSRLRVAISSQQSKGSTSRCGQQAGAESNKQQTPRVEQGGQ